MTELVRGVWGGLRRSVSAVASAIQAPPRPELPFEARVPDGPADVLDELSDGLHATVVQCCAELGIEREVAVGVMPHRDGGNLVEVAAAGRPVAMFSAPMTGPGWAEAVRARSQWALMRRARVLLDETNADRLGSPLVGVLPEGAQAATRDVLEYLLDCGISLHNLANVLPEVDHALSLTRGEWAELLVGQLAASSLPVSVDESVLRDSPDASRTSLIDLRISLFDETGATFPDVRIESHDVPAGQVRLRLNDLTAPPLTIPASATWLDVVAALRPVLRAHGSWFVRANQVEHDRWDLRGVVPTLADLSEAQAPTPALVGCLRSLLANSDSIRNLPRILWLLLEAGSSPGGLDEVVFARPGSASGSDLDRDPEALASMVRRLIGFEAWAGGEATPDEPRVSVQSEWETELLQPSDAGSLANVEWRIARAMFDSLLASSQPVVMVAHTPAAIGPLRRTVRALTDPPRVIGSLELPPDVPLPATIGR